MITLDKNLPTSQIDNPNIKVPSEFLREHYHSKDLINGQRYEIHFSKGDLTKVIQGKVINNYRPLGRGKNLSLSLTVYVESEGTVNEGKTELRDTSFYKQLLYKDIMFVGKLDD